MTRFLLPWLGTPLLLLALHLPVTAQAIVYEPPVYHIYGYSANVPGTATYGWYPAYTSVWPTYGRYVGGYYWPLYASGAYAEGYTPWVYGIYPWAFNSYPVAGAWYGPYVYTFRSYDWRGYYFPWGMPYLTPQFWSYPALRVNVAATVTPAEAVSVPTEVVSAAAPTWTNLAESALDLYGRGRSAYRNGEYDLAVKLLDRAIELKPDDPRFWYIKAIAERAGGRGVVAEGSANRAAALEVSQRPDRRELGEALECVQGSDREWLRNTERLTTALQTVRALDLRPPS